MRYIASCSCGKDSLAMVYKITEQQLPLDEIVFYDTGITALYLTRTSRIHSCKR